MTPSDDDNGNGSDRHGTNPDWPPLSDPEALEDPYVAAGVLKRTITKQSEDERWIERVDGGVIELRENVVKLQKSVDALSARTDKWQRETTHHLGGIDRQIRLLMHHVTVLQWMKISLPYAFAFGMAGFVADLLWRLIRR